MQGVGLAIAGVNPPQRRGDGETSLLDAAPEELGNRWRNPDKDRP